MLLILYSIQKNPPKQSEYFNQLAESNSQTQSSAGHRSSGNGSNNPFDVVRRRNSDCRNLDDPSLKLRDEPSCGIIANNSLAAFVKVLIQLDKANSDKDSTYKGLGWYATLPSIQQRFGNTFSVRMGFGLHFGWAIEGAIGSVHKIDASYLSPHVNVAARLEGATKQFGVPILFSSSLYRWLSPDAQRLCRQLDNITVKGSNEPLGIWTIDVKNFDVDLGDCDMDVKAAVHRATDFSKGFFAQLQDEGHKKFMEMFRKGFDAYISGDWHAAHDLMTKAVGMPGYHEDGPALALIQVIKIAGGTAPPTWSGFRELTEK